MKAERQVQSHPASVDAYIRHGWSLVPIPAGTKGPATPGWNRKEAQLRSQTDLPAGYGIGLAHAYSGTMALDIDHWETAALMLTDRGIDLEALYRAPDAVIVDSGRAGRGKLLYAMPFGLALQTKKIAHQGQTIYELRCGTSNGLTVQDVLPPSIHPDTHQPYRWAGNGHWSRLPEIPPELLTWWMELLDKDTSRTISMENSIDASWNEIQQALSFISPDCSRDEWVNVGMALHWAGSETNEMEQAYAIWDDWSSVSYKYPGQREMMTQWNSFKVTKTNSVRLGTLFHFAKQGGWVRTIPDASELFSEVDFPVLDPMDVLDSGRPKPPGMRLQLWPELLARRADEVASSVGCDAVIPLFAGLAAVCAVVDARIRLELMPGFKVPPVLWLMTLGDPADKKSPGSRPMLAPLKNLEIEDRPRYQKALLEWEGKEAAYSAAKKSFLDWASSSDGMLGGDAPHVPEQPPQPVPLKMTVSDITSQKLVRDAAERPRGLLCYLDEMNGWILKLTDKKSGDDRSAWVVSYEAEHYHYDRVGAGSIHCENLAVSIYGNIQPQVYRQNAKNLSADGLLQRFIPAVIRANRNRVGQPVADELTSQSEWEGLLRLIFAMPAQTYRFSSDAYSAFRKFQHWYEDAKRDERLIDSGTEYMTAFGKLEGLVGRLCLVFHIMEAPFMPEVSVDVVERVIDLTRGYIIPSLRYTLGTVGDVLNNQFEKWMVEYIVHNSDQVREISLSRLRRAARRHLEHRSDWQKDNMIADAMVALESAGWVVKMDMDLSRRTALWAINPNLPNLFPEYRERVIKAKQRHVDYIYRHAYDVGKSRKTIRGYDPDSME